MCFSLRADSEKAAAHGELSEGTVSVLPLPPSPWIPILQRLPNFIYFNSRKSVQRHVLIWLLFTLLLPGVDPSGRRAPLPAVDASAAEKRGPRAALHVRLFDPRLPGSALPRDPAHPGHSDQPCAQFNRELVAETHSHSHTYTVEFDL